MHMHFVENPGLHRITKTSRESAAQDRTQRAPGSESRMNHIFRAIPKIPSKETKMFLLSPFFWFAGKFKQICNVHFCFWSPQKCTFQCLLSSPRGKVKQLLNQRKKLNFAQQNEMKNSNFLLEDQKKKTFRESVCFDQKPFLPWKKQRQNEVLLVTSALKPLSKT